MVKLQAVVTDPTEGDLTRKTRRGVGLGCRDGDRAQTGNRDMFVFAIKSG